MFKLMSTYYLEYIGTDIYNNGTFSISGGLLCKKNVFDYEKAYPSRPQQLSNNSW